MEGGVTLAEISCRSHLTEVRVSWSGVSQAIWWSFWLKSDGLDGVGAAMARDNQLGATLAEVSLSGGH